MKVILPVDENVPYAVIDLRDCKNSEVFYDEYLVHIYNNTQLSDQEKKEVLDSLYATNGIDFFSKYVFSLPKKELLTNDQISFLKKEERFFAQELNETMLKMIRDNLSDIEKAKNTVFFNGQKEIFEKVCGLVLKDCKKILKMKTEDNPELAIYIQQSMMQSEIERERVDFIPLTENEIVVQDRFDNYAQISIKEMPEYIKGLHFEDANTKEAYHTIPQNQKDIEIKFMGRAKEKILEKYLYHDEGRDSGR